MSWEDFTVFETLLKRPDADYWMAFQYFDVCVTPVYRYLRVLLKQSWLATILEPSRSTNSKASSTPAAERIHYRLILIREFSLSNDSIYIINTGIVTGLNYTLANGMAGTSWAVSIP